MSRMRAGSNTTQIGGMALAHQAAVRRGRSASPTGRSSCAPPSPAGTGRGRGSNGRARAGRCPTGADAGGCHAAARPSRSWSARRTGCGGHRPRPSGNRWRRPGAAAAASFSMRRPIRAAISARSRPAISGCGFDQVTMIRLSSVTMVRVAARSSRRCRDRRRARPAGARLAAAIIGSVSAAAAPIVRRRRICGARSTTGTPAGAAGREASLPAKSSTVLGFVAHMGGVDAAALARSSSASATTSSASAAALGG